MKRKTNILIIDDQKTLFYLLQSVLQEDDFDLRFSNNVSGIIDLIDKDEFKTILLNVKVDGEKGMKLFEQLKRDQRIKSIPIILILPKPDVKAIKLYLEKGACDCLVKPLNMQDVKNKICAAINMT
ncbi:MAG: response regulator [Bacteroidales bacterium]|nr:response regulator [Bacteroidales bacterium]